MCCLLVWAVLQPGLLLASDSEAWRELATEYRDISMSLAEELERYQTTFPKLLEITESFPEKLNRLQESSETILTRQRNTLESSKELTSALQQPLNDLKQQTEDLQNSLTRQIRRNEILTYIVIGLVGLTLIDRVVQMR